MAIDQVSAANTNPANSAPPLAAFNDGDGPSFSDLLDIINPLQHIPIINSIYQHLTGDSEGAVADVAGGTLWAGPIGLISSLVDLSMRADGGKSASDRLLSWLGLEGDGSDDGATAIAQNSAPAAANPALPGSAAAQAVAPAALATLAAATPIAVPARAKAKDSDKDSDKTASDNSAPQQRGDYLVFGAAGSAQPMALAAVPTAPAASQDKNGSVGRQGDYLVFGGTAKPRPSPAAAMLSTGPSTPAVAAPPPAAVNSGGYMVFGGDPAPAPVTAAALAGPPPTQTGATAPAGLTPLPARSFAAPTRRNQTAPTALPPPTTGPAAIPGHGPSQAVSLAGDSSWFTDAFNAGLNKYQAAQKLTVTDSAVSAGDSATLH